MDRSSRRCSHSLPFSRMDRLASSRPARRSAQDISSSYETTSLRRYFSSRNERLPHLDVQDESRRESRGMARYSEQSVRVVNVLSIFVFTYTYIASSNSYVWIDWSSMPQPSACPPNTDEKIKKELGTNLGKAVKSIPAYVVILFRTRNSTLTHEHLCTDT